VPLLPRCRAAALGLALSAVLSLPSAAGAAPAATSTAPVTSSPPRTSSSAAPPTSARAQEAAQLVQKMRARMTEVAAQLTKGTGRWEAGQAELGLRQAEAVEAQRAAESSGAQAEDAGTQVREIIAARYRNPVPSGLALLLAPPGGSPTDTVASRAVLAKVQGDDEAALQRATALRVQAEQNAEQVQSGAARTAALVQEQAQELARLQELALRTDAELQAADRELQAVRLADARAWQAAELRKAKLAERAHQRAEAARARRAAAAAAAAAEAARAARAAAVPGVAGTPTEDAATGTGATCTASSTAGYANGFVDESALCPLLLASGHRLQRDAAQAFAAMTRAHQADTGEPLCVTDSYRSYSEQVRVYAEKPSLAAVPGTSNHGWGLALDLCGGVESFSGAAHAWMQRNAGRFGWVHPAWAEPGGSRPEPWHWEFGHL